MPDPGCWAHPGCWHDGFCNFLLMQCSFVFVHDELEIFLTHPVSWIRTYGREEDTSVQTCKEKPIQGSFIRLYKWWFHWDGKCSVQAVHKYLSIYPRRAVNRYAQSASKTCKNIAKIWKYVLTAFLVSHIRCFFKWLCWKRIVQYHWRQMFANLVVPEHLRLGIRFSKVPSEPCSTLFSNIFPKLVAHNGYASKIDLVVA